MKKGDCFRNLYFSWEKPNRHQKMDAQEQLIYIWS